MPRLRSFRGQIRGLAVSKTEVLARVPWVRIPPSPPAFPHNYLNSLIYMANRSIWPTIKPTNAAGLPGDSGGHFRPDPGQNSQYAAPQAPGGAVQPWACPMVPEPWWNYSKPRRSRFAVDILIQQLPSPPSPPPSGGPTAITMPPHTGRQPAPWVWSLSVSQPTRRVEPLQSAGRALPGAWRG